MLLQLMPEVMHSWLIQEVTPEVIEQAKVAGLDGICPRANALTKEGCQTLQDAGFYVRAWGVKTVEVGGHVAQVLSNLRWHEQAMVITFSAAVWSPVIGVMCEEGQACSCCGSGSC